VLKVTDQVASGGLLFEENPKLCGFVMIRPNGDLFLLP
jgi:hypothetical protein